MTSQTTAVPRVPFIDLRAHHESVVPEIDAALREIVRSGQFVLGPAVAAFERAFASYVGVEECVGVNSGTAALQIGLMAIGLEPGGEVILPANTFFATAEAVLWAGGRPVLADVREDDFNLDPEAVVAALTPRTRGIIPVHLYGQPARMEEIRTIADRHGLFVLEDACQAHGAEISGRKAGSLGRAGAFSFYPGKNLGAWGEGGALVTNDPEVARKARMLRDHGQGHKYDHALLGHNFRLEAIQGAVLGVKLGRLDRWNEARARVAGWYGDGLAQAPVRRPLERAGVRHVHHLYVIRSERRDALRAHLAERGIETLVHYPIPLNRQGALAGHGCADAEVPVSERLAAEVISLPIFPELAQEQVRHVCATVEAFFSHG